VDGTGQAAAYPYFEDKPTHQRSTMSANDPGCVKTPFFM
jgi:hypothetical protein